MEVDGRCNVRAASWLDASERAYSGSAQAECGEKAGRVFAARQNWLLLGYTHTHSSDSLVGDPMSGGGRGADFAEAKR